MFNILKDLNNKQINTALVAVMGGFSEGVDTRWGAILGNYGWITFTASIFGILRQSSTSRNDLGGRVALFFCSACCK